MTRERLLTLPRVSVGNPEDTKVAGTFRPNRRPFLFTVVVNVALAAVFLGVPRVREQLRANEARADFARFAECFYGGEARRDPGLGLPVGDTAHFAYLALHAGPGWPERCRPALLEIAPREVTFLLPSGVGAEREVRRAVDLVRRELDRFAVGRATATQVGTRPLRAVGLLRGALAQMVEASGADGGLRNDAVRLSAVGAQVEPSRLPLHAAAEAPLTLEARGDGLMAFALDARGLGAVRLGAGSVDVRRIARPRGVAGVVPGLSSVATPPRPTIPWLVSLTPESRCAEDPFRCARRTMGLAPISDAATAAPTPWQLAAHPWGGALEDAVRVLSPSVTGGPARLAVLARTVDAGPELRVFPLDGAQPLQVPASQQPLDVGGEEVRAAQLLPDGRPVVLVTAGEALRALIFDAEARTSRALGDVPSTGGALLRTCVAEDAVWVAFGSVSEAHLVRASDLSQPPSIANHFVLAGTEQLDEVRALLRCDARGALLVAPLRTGGARLLACEAPDDCRVAALRDLPRTAAVAAARDDGHGVIAYSVRFGRVQAVRVDARGALIGASEVPAACWDDGTGLCGAPTLAARNGRILLVTREGTDLRALETVNGGATWTPLRALR
jgi:hypothetical protein